MVDLVDAGYSNIEFSPELLDAIPENHEFIASPTYTCPRITSYPNQMANTVTNLMQVQKAKRIFRASLIHSAPPNYGLSHNISLNNDVRINHDLKELREVTVEEDHVLYNVGGKLFKVRKIR